MKTKKITILLTVMMITALCACGTKTYTWDKTFSGSITRNATFSWMGHGSETKYEDVKKEDVSKDTKGQTIAETSGRYEVDVEKEHSLKDGDFYADGYKARYVFDNKTNKLLTIYVTIEPAERKDIYNMNQKITDELKKIDSNFTTDSNRGSLTDKKGNRLSVSFGSLDDEGSELTFSFESNK